MQMQIESSDRFNYEKTHKSYVCGHIGRVMPLTAIPCVAGDTVELAANIGMQLTPLVHELVLDCHYAISAFYVPHRKIWNSDDTTPWTDLIGEGLVEDSANAGTATDLSSYTLTVPQYYLPNCRANQAGHTVPKCWLGGYNAILDFWYRDYNYENAYGLDYEETSANGQKFGRAAMQLPTFMNTGLPTARYDAQDFNAVLPNGSGNIELIDIAKVQAEYKTQISRDFWDRRYRDWMKGGWGATGISYDVDDAPEMLFHEEGFMSGVNIMGTDDATLGEARGASAISIPVYMPPKYFNEHGMLWIMALVRLPTVYCDEAHYLAIHALDYKTVAGDPRAVGAQPPHALTINDFRSGVTSQTTDTGFHPYAQWYRTHPDVVHENLHNVAGMPFMQYENITTADRLKKANICDWSTNIQNMFTADASTFGHWQAYTKFHVECKSHIPSATTSVYTGAN